MAAEAYRTGGDYGDMYVDVFPNARFEVLDSAHFCFSEQPEAFAEIVGEFLSERE